MNRSHSSVTDWGLKHVQIDEHFTILDVGCGGGRTIEKLAALATKGMVYGVDYASWIPSEKCAIDEDRPRRNKAGFSVSTTVSRRQIQSRHRRGNPILTGLT